MDPYKILTKHDLFNKIYILSCSSVAQSAERVAVNHSVVGSSPTRGAIFYKTFPTYHLSLSIINNKKDKFLTIPILDLQKIPVLYIMKK